MVEPAPPDATASPTRSRLTWLKLLMWAAVWSVLVIVVIFIFAGLIPPLLLFVALWIAGALWLRRSQKGPAILLLVTFVAYLAMSAPFIIPTLAVPASAGDFILNIASVLGAVVGIIAAIAVLRRLAGSASGAPRGVLIGATALLILSIVLSVVAFVGYDEATAQGGDVDLVAEDLEFRPDELEAESGEVSVFIENVEGTLHTFTIDELDVNLAIPAGKSARVTFQAEPGTYRYYCVPHQPDMEGTLQVR